jgi:hypothetical protein
MARKRTYQGELKIRLLSCLAKRFTKSVGEEVEERCNNKGTSSTGSMFAQKLCEPFLFDFLF